MHDLLGLGMELDRDLRTPCAVRDRFGVGLLFGLGASRRRSRQAYSGTSVCTRDLVDDDRLGRCVGLCGT